MAAQYISDQIGSLEDSVRLQLGDDEVRIATGWDMVEGVLSQPSAWNISLGQSGVIRTLLQKYPPRTPFKIFIGDIPQLSGLTDGRGAAQGIGSGTVARFKGRDALAPLQSSLVKAQETFNNATYYDLVARALKHCGLDASKLVGSNDANRAAKCGKRIVIPGKVTSSDQAALVAAAVAKLNDSADLTRALAFLPKVDGSFITTSPDVVAHQQQAKVNESWLTFIRRHIDKAGLFLWAAADGTFVLSQPNGQQPAIARLIRHEGDPTPGANVLDMDFEDDTTHRHNEAIVYGRGGGKKHGRSKAKGGYEDEEMLGYGFTDQPVVFRDANVQTEAEAEYYARRMLAQERREGWRLSYTIAGLTLPAISGSGGDRVVPTPDSCVEVDDEEIGVQGKFYIETVRRQRSPSTGTVTTIHLMRLQDLIFGGDDQGES